MTLDTVGHCRDCRWWSPMVIIPSGICRAASWHKEGPSRKATASAPDGVTPGVLFTADTFGCVQFEQEPSRDA